MSLRRPLAAFLALSALIVAPSARGRVYWLQEAGPHGATAAGRPGWNRAYAAELKINGGQADLEVIGCQLAASDAERVLAAAYEAVGGRTWAGHGMDLGWGIAIVGSHVVRWLIFPVGRSEECIVVRVTQTREAFLASGRADGRRGISALPELPGAEIRLLVADETARAALDIAETRQSPDSARQRMEDALISAGWTPAAPTGTMDSPPTLFRRGREVCAIHASPAEGGGARLVRLHKLLGSRMLP